MGFYNLINYFGKLYNEGYSNKRFLVVVFVA